MRFSTSATLLEHKLTNYWGYNTLSFFAPEQRYAAENVQNAFRSTVADAARAPASRSSWMSSTTTLRKAIISDRRCAIAASTMSSYYWLVARQSPLLRELHRHRQRAKAHASARAADGDGFAALLGRGIPCRRLPLRSRDHVGAHAGVRSARGLFCRDPPGPGARQRQADCRAVGRRHGGYQVGRFPPGWSEWNDVYRQTVAPLLARRSRICSAISRSA